MALVVVVVIDKKSCLAVVARPDSHRYLRAGQLRGSTALNDEKDEKTLQSLQRVAIMNCVFLAKVSKELSTAEKDANKEQAVEAVLRRVKVVDGDSLGQRFVSFTLA